MGATLVTCGFSQETPSCASHWLFPSLPSHSRSEGPPRLPSSSQAPSVTTTSSCSSIRPNCPDQRPVASLGFPPLTQIPLVTNCQHAYLHTSIMLFRPSLPPQALRLASAMLAHPFPTCCLNTSSCFNAFSVLQRDLAGTYGSWLASYGSWIKSRCSPCLVLRLVQSSSVAL